MWLLALNQLELRFNSSSSSRWKKKTNSGKSHRLITFERVNIVVSLCLPVNLYDLHGFIFSSLNIYAYARVSFERSNACGKNERNINMCIWYFSLNTHFLMHFKRPSGFQWHFTNVYLTVRNTHTHTHPFPCTVPWTRNKSECSIRSPMPLSIFVVPKTLQINQYKANNRIVYLIYFNGERERHPRQVHVCVCIFHFSYCYRYNIFCFFSKRKKFHFYFRTFLFHLFF